MATEDSAPQDPTVRAIVDQSTHTRDPADDSGEADDPTQLADVYPKAFDDRIEQAEAAVAAEKDLPRS